jgi:hypothetical protein
MAGVARKSALSPPQRQLVQMMQNVNFGCIENLHIRDGEPCFDPPPRLVYEIKISGENGPRAESHRRDFALKSGVIQLLAQIVRIQNGIIQTIVVRHGLPQLLRVECEVAD